MDEDLRYHADRKRKALRLDSDVGKRGHGAVRVILASPEASNPLARLLSIARVEQIDKADGVRGGFSHLPRHARS